MTVVAAAVCPWFEPLPEAGIALVADLRFSLGNGRFYDRGAKIFRLGQFGAVAYSGYLASALPAIRRLREFFRKIPKPAYDALTVNALAECLREGQRTALIKARTVLERRAAGDYQAIVAFVTSDESYRYVVYDPRDRGFFMHSRPRGPVLIGHGMSQHHHFMSALNELVFNNTGASLLTGFASYIALAVHKTFLVEQRDPSVGGGVHFVTIDAERGYKHHEMRLVRDSAIPGEYDVSNLTPGGLTALPR